MTSTALEKDQVLFCIQGMPQKFTLDDLFERLSILARVESSEEQIRKGEFYTKGQAKEIVTKWLQK
jgi:hypothetical protein